MKLIGYSVISVIVFVSVNVLSSIIGGFIGSGPYETGLVVNAISFLCAIVVICTMIIVDALEKMTPNYKNQIGESYINNKSKSSI